MIIAWCTGNKDCTYNLKTPYLLELSIQYILEGLLTILPFSELFWVFLHYCTHTFMTQLRQPWEVNSRRLWKTHADRLQTTHKRRASPPVRRQTESHRITKSDHATSMEATCVTRKHVIDSSTKKIIVSCGSKKNPKTEHTFWLANRPSCAICFQLSLDAT